MRRAVIATVGTVVGLVALLDYKSSGTVHTSSVAVGASSGSASTTTPTTAPSSATTTTPAAGSSSTTAPAGSSSTTSPATTAPATTKEVTGEDVSYRYGTIEVRITDQGGKITAITIPSETATDPRSESINSQAIPILTQEALKAQGMNFDVVSGATYTSDAFAQSFSNALSKAKA